MYANDPYELKYQFLINKRESTGLKYSDDPNAFIEYLNNMYDVYKNIDEYNSCKKRKVLIIFDDMIADMINHKKLNSITTELFIKRRKLNISLVFIAQSYFKVPKDVTLNTTHIFITKIANKRELQGIALNDDMIADMINHKKLNSITTELFIKRRKLNISLVFIAQSYFKVPKDVTLNTTHIFITKIANKRELQGIALNDSSDINHKKLMNVYREYTKEQYSFLVIDTTLLSDYPLQFRKKIWNE